jgi:hypothetical protein
MAGSILRMCGQAIIEFYPRKLVLDTDMRSRGDDGGIIEGRGQDADFSWPTLLRYISQGSPALATETTFDTRGAFVSLESSLDDVEALLFQADPRGERSSSGPLT